MSTDESADNFRQLLAILQREPTEEERRQQELDFVSYRAWSAGVEWGATHGRGKWDDAGQAWVEWSTNQRRSGGASW